MRILVHAQKYQVVDLRILSSFELSLAQMRISGQSPLYYQQRTFLAAVALVSAGGHFEMDRCGRSFPFQTGYVGEFPWTMLNWIAGFRGRPNTTLNG